MHQTTGVPPAYQCEHTILCDRFQATLFLYGLPLLVSCFLGLPCSFLGSRFPLCRLPGAGISYGKLLRLNGALAFLLLSFLFLLGYSKAKEHG